MTPSLLGLGDGTNRRAVADLGGNICKMKNYPTGAAFMQFRSPSDCQFPTFCFCDADFTVQNQKKCGYGVITMNIFRKTPWIWGFHFFFLVRSTIKNHSIPFGVEKNRDICMYSKTFGERPLLFFALNPCFPPF